MKTQVIGFIFSNYITILIISVIIIIIIIIINKKYNYEKVEDKKNQNNFLAKIDLKSSRVGAVALILLLIIFYIFTK